MTKQPNPQSGHPAEDSDDPKPKSYERTIARWTIILGASTLALALATGISAYFLWETNQTIKKQVNAIRMQLRAYGGMRQFVSAPAIKKETDKPDVIIGANVAITWKNFGSTPAKEFEYWTSIKWYDPGLEPNFNAPTEKLSDRFIFGLGPGDEIPTTS